MDILIIGYGLIGAELSKELKKNSHNITGNQGIHP
jgi:Trk K+ transport system NAD-binding subunit